MATDPFDALREPLVPLAPRPEFASELRRRLARALAPSTTEVSPVTRSALTPYLACVPADRAIEWYVDVLDAVLLGDPIVMPDGHIGHAELRVGDSVLFLAEGSPAEGMRPPPDLGGTSVTLHLEVPDADDTFRRAVEAGATAQRPVSEQHGARQGVIVDPFGHRWFVSTPVAAADRPIEDVPGRRYGDVGYVTLQVPDGNRAAAFFGALFGWETQPGYQPGAFHISSITPPSGIDTGHESPEVRLYFRVDDIEAAAAKVRELGGQVLSTTDYESGGNAECVDDQGLRFDLFRPRPGY